MVNTFLAGEKHVSQDVYTPSGFMPVRFNGGGDGGWCACNEWLHASRVVGGFRGDVDGDGIEEYDGRYPIAFGPSDDTMSQNYNFGSWHPGICQFAMCDGSVHAFSNDTDTNLLGRLAQRHDGDVVELGDAL